MVKNFLFPLFLIIFLNNVSSGNPTESTEQLPWPIDSEWFINSIGIPKCGALSFGQDSMVIVVDPHEAPFAVAKNMTNLQGRVFYLDADKESDNFLTNVPSDKKYEPSLHATAISGLIAGKRALFPCRYIYFNDGKINHMKSIPVSGVAPDAKIVDIGSNIREIRSLTNDAIYAFKDLKTMTYMDKDGQKKPIFNRRQLTSIINLSATYKFDMKEVDGDPEYEKSVSEEIEFWEKILIIAKNENALLVMAAGNDIVDLGNNNDYIYMPQELKNKNNTILVAAIDKNNKISDFSNFSPELVDIAAPGTEITVVEPENISNVVSGTSFATPLVAGTLALALKCDPYIKPEDLKRILLEEAKAYDGLKEFVRDGKVLDAGRFVNKVCRSKSRPEPNKGKANRES